MDEVDFDDTFCNLCDVALGLHDEGASDPCAVAEARARLLEAFFPNSYVI